MPPAYALPRENNLWLCFDNARRTESNPPVIPVRRIAANAIILNVRMSL